MHHWLNEHPENDKQMRDHAINSSNDNIQREGEIVFFVCLFYYYYISASVTVEKCFGNH